MNNPNEQINLHIILLPTMIMYLYIGSNINVINTKAHVRYTQVDMADYLY